MSYSRIFSVLVLVVVLVTPYVSHAWFYDGYKLKEFSEADDRTETGNISDMQSTDYQRSSQLSGYIIGVADAVDGIVICPTVHAKVEQLVAIVKKYLRENPDKWNKPARDLVIDSLSASFPCKR